MDIKVGEYIRTEEGHIGKIEKIIENTLEDDTKQKEIIIDNIFFNDCGEASGFVYYKDIKKHSFDIKELIEKSDIVEYSLNAIMVPGIAKVSEYREARTNKKYLGVLGYKLDQIKILRILTEEQFKNVSYEV